MEALLSGSCLNIFIAIGRVCKTVLIDHTGFRFVLSSVCDTRAFLKCDPCPFSCFKTIFGSDNRSLNSNVLISILLQTDFTPNMQIQTNPQINQDFGGCVLIHFKFLINMFKPEVCAARKETKSDQ